MTPTKFDIGIALLKTELDQQELTLRDYQLKLACLEFAKNPSPKNQAALLREGKRYGDQYFSLVDTQIEDKEED